MKTLLLALTLLFLSGCATYPDYDWEGTADNWHKKVEMGRR